MSLNALRCGLAALLGLGATVFSLSSAQTPVLPDASLAERAIEPAPAPTVVLTIAPKSSIPDAMPAAPFKASVTVAATPAKPSSAAAPSKIVAKTVPVVKPSSVPAPSKINPSKVNPNKVNPDKVNEVSSVQPSLKPTTTVRYVQASSARSYVVRSTAYNSAPGQTDSSPHITATGTRTRFGVVALSRDLLSFIPYGSRIRIQDLSGTSYNRMLSNTVFIVEDTMNARMSRKVDVWMGTRSQALNWGSRSIRITVVN